MRTALRERKIVNLKVNAALWAALKRHAKVEHVHMRDVIEFAVREYLEAHSDGKPDSPTQ